MNFLGIDPGLTGALALLDPDSRVLAVAPMPVCPSGKGEGKTVSEDRLAELIQSWRLQFGNDLLAFVERQQAMPGQGSVSGFTIGENFGAIRGVLGALAIRRVFVRAQNWQKLMMPGHGLDRPRRAQARLAEPVPPDQAKCLKREAARARAERRRVIKSTAFAVASRLWPDHASAKHEAAFSDALLIAEYGRRSWNPSASPHRPESLPFEPDRQDAA